MDFCNKKKVQSLQEFTGLGRKRRNFMTQLSFFDINKPKPTGIDLRDRGIKRALHHAEDVHDEWGAKALDFLYLYSKNHLKFSGEMVRLESKGIVPDPPSLRAWGAVLLHGARKGWIKRIGYIQVENPKAHRANASLWESLI